MKEQSIATYFVERSVDSLSFEIIDSLPSLRVFDAPSDYTDLDTHVPGGKVYYKIGAQDTLGIMKYSGAVSIGQVTTPAPAASAIRLHPNPATNYLYVQYPASPNSSVLKILDMRGLVIKTYSIEPNSSIVRIITSGLDRGIYVISWSDGLKMYSTPLQIR